MKITLALAIWLATILPVSAQGWQEYRDTEMGFAASFPGTPAVTETMYKTGDGASLDAKLYALRQGTSEFRIIVADFSNAPLQDEAAIADAVKTLSATGKVTVDIAARVNQNYGRQLSLDLPDGSREVSAVFFVNKHLYQIEGISHPGEDSNSSDPVRFQQSLNFLGGFGGRRGRRGFGGYGG